MPVRRVTSSLLAGLALVAPVAAGGCGAGGHARPSTTRSAPPGKIEALREAQERAQEQIEAEGLRHSRKLEREREAVRKEAEREAESGTRTRTRTAP